MLKHAILFASLVLFESELNDALKPNTSIRSTENNLKKSYVQGDIFIFYFRKWSCIQEHPLLVRISDFMHFVDFIPLTLLLWESQIFHEHGVADRNSLCLCGILTFCSKIVALSLSIFITELLWILGLFQYFTYS